MAAARTGQTLAVAQRQILVNRRPAVVWSVLADGYAYAHWVVGTTQIREVDSAWPETGSSIYYTVGRGRFRFDDRSTVRLLEPERRIELEANAPPLGSARVAIGLIPWGDGETVIILDEHPLRGRGAQLHSGVVELLLHLRNRRMLNNLARVVHARQRD